MKTNPFKNVDRGTPAETSLCPETLSSDIAGVEADERARRWVKRVCKASVLFLALVLFLFRENQHAREQYLMSRMVTAAEAERRQWQERVRLAEGHAAAFIAVMHAQQALPPPPKMMPANYVVPARRR
ncbi:MAG TPA: hypothetical protein VI136_17985 [Verrucomicrobiae bacterium]